MKKTLIATLLFGLLTVLVNGAMSQGERKVTICHVPPGNPENAHSITIGEPAVAHHLANHPGDSIGECHTPTPTPTPPNH